MTLQDIITAVSTNLGNRASGKIGNQAIDSVILRAVNGALVECVKEANPEFYDREAEVTLVAPDRVYPLPVVDVDGETIRIKDVVWHRTSYSDSKGSIHMPRVPYRTFVAGTQDWDSEDIGTPGLMAIRQEKIYIDKIPSSSYKLTLFVEVFPPVLGTQNLNEQLPIDDEWAMALECFATHFCYIKLQQIELADYWLSLFQRQKMQTSRTTRKSEGRVQGQDTAYGIGAQPHLNPAVNSWN